MWAPPLIKKKNTRVSELVDLKHRHEISSYHYKRSLPAVGLKIHRILLMKKFLWRNNFHSVLGWLQIGPHYPWALKKGLTEAGGLGLSYTSKGNDLLSRAKGPSLQCL